MVRLPLFERRFRVFLERHAGAESHASEIASILNKLELLCSGIVFRLLSLAWLGQKT
jgi:hypothetical protein